MSGDEHPAGDAAVGGGDAGNRRCDEDTGQAGNDLDRQVCVTQREQLFSGPVLRHPGGGRSYTGMVNGGVLRSGQEVVVLPDGWKTTVTGIETFDGPLDAAPVGLSVADHLADDLDVSRGNLVAAADPPPAVVRGLTATVCWFTDRPLRSGDRLRVSTPPAAPRPGSPPCADGWT